MATTRFQALPVQARVYVMTVVAVGAATVIQSFYAIAAHPIGWNWAILAVLTLASGSATVRLPSLPATISVSETFVFTSVLLFGSAAGTLTVALDALVISFWSYRKGHPAYKIIFNVCALPLTIWIAAHLFFAFPLIEPLVNGAAGDPVRIKTLVGPLLVFTVAYFLLNSGVIAVAISLERRSSPFKIWTENFPWLSLNYFGGASVAALLVSYTKDVDFTYLAVIVPLLIVLYLTFSLSVGRVEDANKHLTQLNDLYMSTIETLAMAIDAKDQITHGHIRRVQEYAVALAKEVGVTEDSLIRAIEAAALLHDMGKLAVPEYILNKPGPLTPAEFEKMKLHASVGADILSSIAFPYPVVPIVRHHHENWDGTGYPAGLRGTDIPFGARILSVVDCFDALTSDRPYRPRLSDKEALRIIFDRRGSMYDPLVVDTFARVQAQIPPQNSFATSESTSLLALVDTPSRVAVLPTHAPHPFEEISASSEENLTLFNLSKDIASAPTYAEGGAIICKHLRRLVPCSLCVIFEYDVSLDDLVTSYARGEHSQLATGLRISLGQRLSGWVAANRQTIRNSDPLLDLGDSARGMKPRLRACLSTPLTVGSTLVGVLTVYSTEAEGFSESHQRLSEAVARQISGAVERWAQVEKGNFSPSEPLSSLPSVESVRSLISRSIPEPCTVIALSIKCVRVPASTAEHQGHLSVLSAAAELMRRQLGASALLIRASHDELAGVLPETTEEDVAGVLAQIEQQLDGVIAIQRLPLHARLAVASVPRDGATVGDALKLALLGLLPTKDPGSRTDPEKPIVH